MQCLGNFFQVVINVISKTFPVQLFQALYETINVQLLS